ncbi:MAG: hypothetical protein HZB16_22510 [Armatimonadetes bacterium]|nr:hypothetical protein [Armatimonadota bacterium]
MTPDTKHYPEPWALTVADAACLVFGGLSAWFHLAIGPLLAAVTAGLALLGLAGTRLYRGTARTSVSLNDAPPVERYFWLFRRDTFWLSVSHIDAADVGATLRAGRRTVWIGPPLSNWRGALEACRRHCDLAAPGEGQTAAAEEVAEWLGIASGETLVLRSGSDTALLVVAALLLLPWLLLLFADAELRGLWPLLLATAAFGMSPGMWFAVRHRAREIRADAQGLSVRTLGGWLRLAWANVLSLGQDDGCAGMPVKTSRGTFRLPPGLDQRDRLICVLREVIAARGRGEVLPRLTDSVPDTALSLTGAVEAEAERGLSRTD